LRFEDRRFERRAQDLDRRLRDTGGGAGLVQDLHDRLTEPRGPIDLAQDLEGSLRQAGCGRALARDLDRCLSDTRPRVRLSQSLDRPLRQPRHRRQATSIPNSAAFTPTLVQGAPVAGSTSRMADL
jgi:hypothetical protein